MPPPSATPPASAAPVEWLVSDAPRAYPVAVAAMEERATRSPPARRPSRCGCSSTRRSIPPEPARKPPISRPDRFPVFRSGRGGEYTYHGPGQRVAYVMLDLNRRGPTSALCRRLEEWIIRALARFNVKGERREDRVGIWVPRPEKRRSAREDKIAAIGIRLRRWVSFHGIALNVDPELDAFLRHRPLRRSDHGVTSLADSASSFRCRRSTCN